jgi:hypothetical protein
VADTVWLIYEETMLPGYTPFNQEPAEQNIQRVGSPHCYCGPGWGYLPPARSKASQACTSTARSNARPSALTGYPAADTVVYGRSRSME